MASRKKIRESSRSCENCRAIKRRCDKNLPHCGQCIRTRTKCLGYRDEWALVFRDQTERTIKRVKEKNTKRAASTDADYSALFAHDLDSSADQIDVNYFLELQYFNRPQPLALSQSSNLNQTIVSGPMMRDQVFSFYLRNYFPQKREQTYNIDMSQFVISGIYALPQKSPMLEKACSALSCVFLGKIHHRQQILQHGLRLYNHAIRQLANAISRNAFTDDIVYTCVIFQQVQTHHCPHSLREWITHIDGLSAIMRYYGPKTLTTPLLAAIFGQYQKSKVVLTGFMFLSEETIAWLKEPNEGGLWFESIGLLTEISRIATAINATDVSDHDTCKSLLDDCLALEKSHMDFWMQINQNIDGEPPTYARGELKSGITSTNDLFGPAYRFSSLNDAILHTFLWLSLSFVYLLIRKCRTLIMADMPNSFPIDDIEDRARRLSMLYVTKAIRCLPYCGQEGMNSWSISYGVFVASQASRAYIHSKDWERFLWAQDVFIYMERAGFDNAGRFHDIFRNYWFESHRHDAYRVLNFRKLDNEHKASLHGVTEGNVSKAAMYDGTDGLPR